MFIKSISIKNFRCFEDEPISFSTPDGTTKASGLNIFIGENGNGKTSILEAICYPTQSRLKTKSTIRIRDFLNIKKEIEITEETDEFEVDKVYGKAKFKCKGFSFQAKTRDAKSNNLLDPLVFDNKFIPLIPSDVNAYEGRLDVTKPWGGSRLPDFNIVFFDKNRTRHISKGMFPAKFDELIDDLNFQILEKINSLDETIPADKLTKEQILGVNETIRKILLDVLSDKFLGEVLKDCEDYFKEEIKLEIITNLEPFLTSFFAARKVASNQQLPISKLGSGVEMIFSIIFLYRYYMKRGGNVIFLIDEPELHLHPIWQNKLMEFLMNISKNTQVFISTHSPYLFKNSVVTKAGMLLFGRDGTGKVSITDAKKTGWGLFPWSPSWGEINFYAYNLPTIEFHNELYGHLQEISTKYIEPEFEAYLISKGVVQTKPYIRIQRDGTLAPSSNITICTYIRNQIHHPENTNNITYTEAELKTSIETMVKLIK